MKKELRGLAVSAAVLLWLAVIFGAAADGTTLYLPIVLRQRHPAVVLISLGNPITVQGPGAVVSGSTVTITAGGAYRAVGTLTDGMIAIDTTAEVELTLAGVTITHAKGPAINVINAEKLSLVLAAGTTNTLTDGPTYSDISTKGTLFSNDTLEISGDGALVVTGKYKHGIVSDDDLIIRSGNITIVATKKDGFHANDNITVYGGTITILSSGSDGFESEGDLRVDGGRFMLDVADDGIIGQDTVTINGGIIEVDSGFEGIESKDNLIINGGDLSIAVSDDALNATNDITIEDGRLYLNTGGDAIDSNGTMSINGGIIVALGGATPESGLDCDMPPALNGGIVVVTGSDNSTPSSDSEQRVVLLGGTEVGTIIHIVREDGAAVLTFQVTKPYGSMVFTSADLQPYRAYTAYTGGSVSGAHEFYGLYSGATYSGGQVWVTFTTDAVVTHAGGAPPLMRVSRELDGSSR